MKNAFCIHSFIKSVIAFAKSVKRASISHPEKDLYPYLLDNVRDMLVVILLEALKESPEECGLSPKNRDTKRDDGEFGFGGDWWKG